MHFVGKYRGHAPARVCLNGIYSVLIMCRSDECNLSVQTEVVLQKIHQSDLCAHIQVAWVAFEKTGYSCSE